MSVTIKLRRGNASDWTSQNIVLASGEPGYEIDTGRFKIGDGSTVWTNLDYASVVPTGILAGSGINIDLGTNGSTATISVSGLTSSYISDFNEAVDDRVGSGLFVAGTGINLNYNDAGNSFTVSVTGLISNPADNRILTSRDSTTTGIDAKSNLTFDGALLDVSGNVSANTGVFDSITVTDTGLVNNLNSDLLDNQEGSYYLDWTYTTNKPDPIITGVLTGDVAGTGSVTLTDLQNGTLTINATIQPDSVALGTDTTGDYVSEVTVSGTGLSVTGAGEDATYNIVSNATPANVANTIISRDSGGNFVASTGNFDIIQFNTDNGQVDTQGQIGWNDTDGTVDVALTDTAIVHIGEHTLYRIRNTTGDVLYKGQTVYASGIHSNGIITPDLYVADGSIREIRFMGLVFEDINNNNNGYVINFGHISNIDTRGNVPTDYAVGDETWLDGDILYVHPTVAGKLTKNEPKHSIAVAIILDAASNGKIFVRPTSYGHLDDNHDVNVSGVTNGQFLQYNSATDYWVPSSSGNFTTLTADFAKIGDSQYLSTSGGIIGVYESDHTFIIDCEERTFYADNIISLSFGNRELLDSSGVPVLYWSGPNKIGIKTNSPAYTLDVNGSGNFSDSLNVDNLRLDGNTLSATNANGNLIVQNNGTGALQRDSGGNARGQYAVDLQNVRSSSTMVAAGNYSVIGGGRNNTSSGYISTVGGGFSNTSSGTNSTVGGGRYNTSSGSYSTVGGGFSNTSSGYTSTVGGGRSNTASNYYSTVAGGYYNTASGNNSTVGGGRSNTASATYSTVAGGFVNTASGSRSAVGGGYYNTASGSRSAVCGGYTNAASSTYSFVGGGRSNTASATYSTVGGGFRGKASRYGENSHASGRFANDGDAQHTVLIARKLTTNNTANQVLFLDNSSARLTLPAETTWTFEVKLSAYNDTDNAAAGWIFRGVIRRNAANGTALVGSLIEENWKETAMNSTSASVVADDTNEALEIRVTGLTGKNIRWVAVVDISQVSYGTP